MPGGEDILCDQALLVAQYVLSPSYPVRSILWHVRQFESASSVYVSPDPKGGDAT